MSAATVDPTGKIRVGFIVGATGAGKSALAIAVAERLGAEIVNADSRQFYRGMDVGTAKPSADDRRRVPHHLIDVREPDRPLDVAEFAKLAHDEIAEIAARGRRPLVVGGSGLYLRVLRGGIFRGPPASPEIREKYSKIAADCGAPHLHDRLRKVDAGAAARIGVNDAYRIIRALEVFELTGETITAHQQRHRFSGAEYECLAFGLEVDRERLYESIDRRFDEMIAGGLLDEVRRLLAAGYAPDRPPLCTIGYKQIAAHVRGEITLEEAVMLAKRDSRRLAKRQLTWFRREPDIRWQAQGPLDGAGNARDAHSDVVAIATETFEKFFAGGERISN